MTSPNFFSKSAGDAAWCHEHFCWADCQPEGHYFCPQGHEVEVFRKDDRVVIRNGLDPHQRCGIRLDEDGPFTVVDTEPVCEGEEPTWGHHQFLHFVSGGRPRKLSAFYFTHAA